MPKIIEEFYLDGIHGEYAEYRCGKEYLIFDIVSNEYFSSAKNDLICLEEASIRLDLMAMGNDGWKQMDNPMYYNKPKSIEDYIGVFIK